MENDIYTGREIAVITDIHGLLEPTVAALEDIESRGITEIYSLGDNIGNGPNPREVMMLLKQYGVISIAGNSEDYVTLGVEPFSYLGYARQRSHEWTKSQLTEKQIGEIKMFPHSIDLFLGGKKIALCHFIGDVRFDYRISSTWSYQDNMKRYGQGYKQFERANSDEQKEYMEEMIERLGRNNPAARGFLSGMKEPLFGGKKVSFYDAIIQGHVHFKLFESSPICDIYTIRAVGMAYQNDPIDSASYVILKEKKNNQGFDFIEVLVKFDREKMINSIISSDMEDKSNIELFTSMRRR